ncbi:ASCH domain-containing protein [Paraburkholderia sp. SARCC-3016]|uniref:ASCH domain-containing protein n=1 Tax=Paraburkholderia sp. SARCC-3016 TaxID=3058611 RepID=UPI0028082D61|nr:ASCH domain-containing protein [Paraburkholderia sp. SARCC-3016]MDQ7982249.1 ASCH domain-containing protein [Paraburkholderia sp. SARCC-3016]
MKILSIRQPWAWLIVRPDIFGDEARRQAYATGLIKDVENRTWATKFRGEFLIHASMGLTRREYEDVCDFLYACDIPIKLPPFEELQRGGVVGAATLVDCVDWSESQWYMGAKGFVLRDARPLPFVPCKGALNFFELPDIFPALLAAGFSEQI